MGDEAIECEEEGLCLLDKELHLHKRQIREFWITGKNSRVMKVELSFSTNCFLFSLANQTVEFNARIQTGLPWVWKLAHGDSINESIRRRETLNQIKYFNDVFDEIKFEYNKEWNNKACLVAHRENSFCNRCKLSSCVSD